MRKGTLRRDVLRGMLGVVAADVMMAGAMKWADADVMPRVYTRREWGAVPPRRPPRVLDHPPDHIIVHHTASPNVPDMSRAHAFTLSRQIQRYHMKNQGWDDIGEQLTISRGGYVMEGRAASLPAIQQGRLVVGAQSLHHNNHTIGIENEGTYLEDDVPGRLWASLVDVCAWLCTAYRLDPAEAIVGHRDYNDTDCPGDVLYRRLPRLRAEVGRALDDAHRTEPPPGPDADPPSDERRRLTSHHHRRLRRHGE
ncbi:peptidoglycan recognition protein family protein [Actinoallomurus rhizosphaericola]|uniref:peptidoglycan recognition protein family protein n=1 Tax=Actinoallomurus rhizosphaericola TaxID=2952536 RepID=UPI002092CC67|nr:peptidoglycan recognition family protein [Actinoallomurus rhizosphaericola]MCO5995071.1 peptidoglycan recognition protein family protein [Actinoallomurus rhizosphaericola]